MRVLLFGASGMVGQGVLRECLASPDVEEVVCVVRKPLGQAHAKLAELVQDDVADLSALAKALPKFDACFFPLGVSSAGMKEDAYRKVTHDLTLSIARQLHEANPELAFVYVSGAGTDSTEKGRSMWARVKGRTENALLRMPFHAAYMFRPGFIQPLHGIRSKTRLYSTLYTFTIPLLPLLRRFPRFFTTTERLGRAMLAAAKSGAPNALVESDDINRLGV